jgi:hypothetical protein
VKVRQAFLNKMEKSAADPKKSGTLFIIFPISENF